MRIPKLPELWRLLREMDLEAVRREAERPFQVLVVGEGDVAEALSRLLSGPDGSHPWVLSTDAAEARRHAGSGLIDLAIVGTPTADPVPGLQATIEVLASARVPTVTAVLAPMTRRDDALVRAGETARALVPELDASGVDALAEGVVAAAPPPLRIALARQLPPLRPRVLSALIEDAARTNALYSLTTGLAEVVPVLNAPLNLADVVVLTKNQLLMSYRVALAAGKRGKGRELVAEVAGVIGGGLLLRQAGRQLIGLVPGAGIVPKVAVAYAGTVAIGRAVAAWAVGGERLTRETVRAFYREAWQRAGDVARDLVARARAARPRLQRPKALRGFGRRPRGT
jgi:uncharacterized protein (DUF697 family)